MNCLLSKWENKLKLLGDTNSEWGEGETESFSDGPELEDSYPSNNKQNLVPHEKEPVFLEEWHILRLKQRKHRCAWIISYKKVR